MGLPYKHEMTVAAHCGDRYNSFENTMEAFEAARLQGADMIETDVRMTKDGHLILIHDEDTFRTTGETGLVGKLTLEQIRSRNAGNALHPLQIPTLEEFLIWAQPYDLLLNIEIKEYYRPGNEERCRACVDQIVALVRKYGLEDRIVLNCFDAWALEYVDKAYDHRFLLHGFYPYTCMHNVKRNPDEYLYCACIWGCNSCKEYYDYLLQHGIEPWVGSSVTSASMLELVCQYGAKLITTDNSADIISKLERLGKRA